MNNLQLRTPTVMWKVVKPGVAWMNTGGSPSRVRIRIKRKLPVRVRRRNPRSIRSALFREMHPSAGRMQHFLEAFRLEVINA